jgi:hypothetical protein
MHMNRIGSGEDWFYGEGRCREERQRTGALQDAARGSAA